MDTKNWWESKAIWGAIIAFAAFMLSFFGVAVTAEEQATLIDLLAQGGAIGTALVGLILTIVGRMKATKKIGRR